MATVNGYVAINTLTALLAVVAPYIAGSLAALLSAREKGPRGLVPALLGAGSMVLVAMLARGQVASETLLAIIAAYTLSGGLLTLAAPRHYSGDHALPWVTLLAGGLLGGVSGYALSYYAVGPHSQVLSLVVASLALFSLAPYTGPISLPLGATGALSAAMAVYASLSPGGVPWPAPAVLALSIVTAVLVVRAREARAGPVGPLAGAALLLGSAGPVAGSSGVVGPLTYIGAGALLVASCYLLCGESRAIIPAALGAIGAMLVGRSLAGAYDPLLGAPGLLAGVALGTLLLALSSRARVSGARLLAVVGVLLLALAPVYYSVSEAVIVERHLPHAGIPVDTCGLQLEPGNASIGAGPVVAFPVSGPGLDRLASAVRSEEALVSALATALEGDEGALVWLAAKHNTTVRVTQVALVDRVVIHDFAANTTVDINLTTPVPLLVELEQPAILQAAVSVENGTPVFRASVRVRGLVLAWNALGGAPVSPVHSVVEMWFNMPMVVASPDGRVALTIEKAVVSALDIVGGRSTVEDTPLGQRVDPALVGVEKGYLSAVHPTRGTTTNHEVPANVSRETLEALEGLVLIGEEEPQLQKLLQWEPTLALDLLQLAPGASIEVVAPSLIVLTLEAGQASLAYTVSPAGGAGLWALLPVGLDTCALRLRGDPEGGNLSAALLAWNASQAGATPLQVAAILAWGGYERIPDTLRLVGMLEDGSIAEALRYDSIRLRFHLLALLLPFIAVLPLLTQSASGLRASLASRRAPS